MIVVWTPVAEEQAAAIVESMRSKNAGVAWRWLQAMLARVRGLSERGCDGEGLREAYIAPCRVIYRLQQERMVVLALCVVGRRLDEAVSSAEYPRVMPRAWRDRP